MTRLDAGQALACSLNDDAFRERRALARRTLLPKLHSMHRNADGVDLSFADSPRLREQLNEFVDLERRCCGFLKFSIKRITTDGVPMLCLQITGPPDAAKTVDMFAVAAEHHLASHATTRAARHEDR